MATTKKAPRRQPTKKADARTVERVPAADFRALAESLGLTQRDVADAVGRSTSLVGGWYGHTGQMRPGKKGGPDRPTNPLLAKPRLAEVTKALKAHAAQKAKAGKAAAKAEGQPYMADATPNPKDLDRQAHEAAEAKPARPHVPPELIERRRAQKAARETAAAN